MKEVITVEFDGYWLKRYQSEIPQEAGIYCVYACEPMANDRIVVLRELIYVGESDHVNVSIAEHEEVSAWKERLQVGEELCYSFASVNRDVRSRVLVTSIFHHRSPCNRMEEQGVCDTKLTIVGEHELLDDRIAVGNE